MKRFFTFNITLSRIKQNSRDIMYRPCFKNIEIDDISLFFVLAQKCDYIYVSLIFFNKLSFTEKKDYSILFIIKIIK